MAAVMTATDRETLRSEQEQQAYDRAERSIGNWGVERRAQDRQLEQFHSELRRISASNRDDGVSAIVFHGARQLSRRERIIQEFRREAEAEQRRDERSKAHRELLAVCRRTGAQRVRCRHCGGLVSLLSERPKCERCKHDVDLVTARGTEKRSFIERPEPQPPITPLSSDAQRIEQLVQMLPARLRDPIERRYLHKQGDWHAAEDLMMPVAMYAGLTRDGVKQIARWLAEDAHAWL